MSNKFGQGLFSADGPLYLWHDFMKVALNQPWDWNGKAPVPNDDFTQPAGVVTADVCRFSGMAATNACGLTIKVPFLEGTVPPPDNVHVNKTGGGGPAPTPDASGNVGIPVGGPCFDVVAEVAQDSRRPPEMVAAARRWADRFVNGQWAPKGNSGKIGELGPDAVWLLISPLKGNNGSFGAPICGQIHATPVPLPSESFGTGGFPLVRCGHGKPLLCSPTPSPAAALAGQPSRSAGVLAPFAIPAILGGVPLLVRARRWARRAKGG